MYAVSFSSHVTVWGSVFASPIKRVWFSKSFPKLLPNIFWSRLTRYQRRTSQIPRQTIRARILRYHGQTSRHVTRPQASSFTNAPSKTHSIDGTATIASANLYSDWRNGAKTCFNSTSHRLGPQFSRVRQLPGYRHLPPTKKGTRANS